MSCYEEEAGSYLLGVGEYRKLKNQFKKQYADTMRIVSGKIANKVKLLKAEKSSLVKAGSDFYELVNALEGCNRRAYNSEYISGRDFEALCDELITRTKSGLIANITAKQIKATEDVCCKCVGFNDNALTVYWRVDNNNHAVSDARESLEGKLFFYLLSGVKWRGKQGGAIRYTSEYLTNNGPCDPDVRDAMGWEEKEERRKLDYMIRRLRA